MDWVRLYGRVGERKGGRLGWQWLRRSVLGGANSRGISSAPDPDRDGLTGNAIVAETACVE